MPKSDDEQASDYDESGAGRSFWSGTVAFGLVSLPVNLFVANRPRRVSLRMLDEDGTPLKRRYFCTQEDKPLDNDDLVRGYEIEKDKFIEIDDEELEALTPKKSREIDLRRFVPLASIDPMFFERAYFLVPDEGASKAYRLLAQSMETMGRAGIATFVMRGKEYLVAIIAEGGVLRAETLRFHDELRSPEDVGLPTVDKAVADEVRRISKAIDNLTVDELDRSELSDDASVQLMALVERKLESGEDVVHAPDLPEAEQGAEVIDLMKVLRQSLEGKVGPETEQPRREKESRKKDDGHKRVRDGKASKQSAGKSSVSESKQSRGPSKHGAARKTSPKKIPSKASKKSKTPPKPVLDPEASKSELYELAKEFDIPGRSHMSKQELLRALEQPRR